MNLQEVLLELVFPVRLKRRIGRCCDERYRGSYLDIWKGVKEGKKYLGIILFTETM